MDEPIIAQFGLGLPTELPCKTERIRSVRQKTKSQYITLCAKVNIDNWKQIVADRETMLAPKRGLALLNPYHFRY
jgi:hypothetical protein